MGRDENVSKMDVDSVDCRPGRLPVEKRQDEWRRPVENLSLVDVDQLKTSGWSTSTSRKRQDGWRRRRPVEKLSLFWTTAT